MATLQEILARAQALREETALGSISPERAGSIMYDTLQQINQMQLEGGSLVISKIYESVAAMQADTAPVSDLTGQDLRQGQLVVIVPSDTSSSDLGSVYRYNGTTEGASSWSFTGKIGGYPMDQTPTQGSTRAVTSGGVYEQITQLGQELSDTFSGHIGFSLSNTNPVPSDFPEYVNQKGRLTLLNAQDSYLWVCLTSRYFGIEAGGIDIPMTFVAQVGDLFCYVSDEVIKAGTMVAVIKIRELAKSQDERLIITATSYSVKYGDAMPTFSWSANGPVEGEPEITCAAGVGSPAGEYPIVISRGTVTDGNAIYVDGVLTIEKAELTVTADNKQVAVGGTMPAFTVQYSGFVLDEDETALTTEPTCITDAEDTDTDGFFTITPQGGVADNYSFIYVSGILQIGDPVTLSWTSAQVYAAQSTKAYIDTSTNVWKIHNEYTGVLIKCDFWRGKKIKFTRSANWTGIRYAFLRSFQGTTITNDMVVYFSQQPGYTTQITNTTDVELEETVPSDALYMYVYAKSSSLNAAPSIDWKGALPTAQYRNLEASLFTANKTIGSDGMVYTGVDAPAVCCTTSRVDVSTFARLFKFGQILNRVPDVYERMKTNIAEYTATGAFLRRQSYAQVPHEFSLSPAAASLHIMLSGQVNGVDVPIESVPFDGDDIQAIGTA